MSIERDQFPQEIALSRFVVQLPDLVTEEAIAAVEVLVQEGFRVLSFAPGGELDIFALHQIFKPRASFCLHGIESASQLAEFELINPKLVFAANDDVDLAAGLAQSQYPYCVPALTPNEVRRAWQGSGCAAVEVTPAGVLNSNYAEILHKMMPDTALLAAGVSASYEVRAWLGAGAVAVALSPDFVGSRITGTELSALRRRCRVLANQHG